MTGDGHAEEAVGSTSENSLKPLAEALTIQCPGLGLLRHRLAKLHKGVEVGPGGGTQSDLAIHARGYPCDGFAGMSQPSSGR